MVCRILKDANLDRSEIDLQHIRRFVKPEYLPTHVRELLLQGGLEQDVACLFMCPTSRIELAELISLFRTHKASPFCNAEASPKIVSTAVPSYAPTSAAQAADWSQRYWPISYKNTNPYGPHPALVGRAEAELLGSSRDGVATKLQLAEKVASEAQSVSIGEKTGCVIVARHQPGFTEKEVVAVAGDARWCGNESRNGPGNVTAHAVMRAIGMVAFKRRKLEAASEDSSSISSQIADARNEEMVFKEEPLTSFESHYLSINNLAPNGYLCCELEIYITHEPCVMCSMAILHSRFSRCIFGRRMPLTGAMTADSEGLGHGLFWRPAELNWKLLCWELESSDGNDTRPSIDEKLHV